MLTFPFIYEAEFINGSIDISIDYLHKNSKWNLFITGDISGIYFSYSNINLENNQLTLNIIRNITYEIMKSTNCRYESLWYIHLNEKYERKHISQFGLAKESVTSNIITTESHSHKHVGNDHDRFIKEYPHYLDGV
jgi:hypothetical protein